MARKLTTEQFIDKAIAVHGNKYDYSLINYKNNITKVDIICKEHGIFEQTPSNHLSCQGCPKCGRSVNRKSIEQFIIDAYCKHGDRYNYKLVDYKNNKTKIKIICKEHGVFEQRPGNHIKGHNCPKCYGNYYNNKPYDRYALILSKYSVKCRRNKDNKDILEVKCMYCGKWYIPEDTSIRHKIEHINGKGNGECNLYCSDACKQACPTYHKVKYPKGYKIGTSREVQPALRKLVLERDNYTCQKCGSTDKQLHCHHMEGIRQNPIESADMDICITFCIDCHKDAHKEDGCRYIDMQCKETRKLNV